MSRDKGGDGVQVVGGSNPPLPDQIAECPRYYLAVERRRCALVFPLLQTVTGAARSQAYPREDSRLPCPLSCLSKHSE
jgi:hypothetical protein